MQQYGLLALHNTTHDQIFLSFLTTYVPASCLGGEPLQRTSSSHCGLSVGS
jgi:hypothetical protein